MPVTSGAMAIQMQTTVNMQVECMQCSVLYFLWHALVFLHGSTLHKQSGLVGYGRIYSIVWSHDLHSQMYNSAAADSRVTN